MRAIRILPALTIILLVYVFSSARADTTYTLNEITKAGPFTGTVYASKSFMTSNGNYFVYPRANKIYHLKKWENYQTHHEITLSGNPQLTSICSYDDDELAVGVTSSGTFYLFNFLTKEIFEEVPTPTGYRRLFCQPKTKYLYASVGSADLFEFIYDPTRYGTDKYYLSYTYQLPAQLFHDIVDTFVTPRGLLIVGSFYISLWDREKKIKLEEYTVQGNMVSSACYNQKEGKLFVGRGGAVGVFDIEHLDVIQYSYSPSGTSKVACDISGEFIFFTHNNIINHHFITSIPDAHSVLTLPTYFSYQTFVNFFETPSVTNLFAAMIQTSGSTSELRLYEFSVDCDPSCKTCTHKCGCAGTNNKLVYTRGVCKSSCAFVAGPERYEYTDRNQIQYCTNSCPNPNNGFMLTGNTCFDCPKNCRACNTPSTCRSCLTNRFLYGPLTLPNYQTCVSIQKGYFSVGGGVAQKCMASCKTCVDATSPCSTCYGDKQR